MDVTQWQDKWGHTCTHYLCAPAVEARLASFCHMSCSQWNVGVGVEAVSSSSHCYTGASFSAVATKTIIYTPKNLHEECLQKLKSIICCSMVWQPGVKPVSSAGNTAVLSIVLLWYNRTVSCSVWLWLSGSWFIPSHKFFNKILRWAAFCYV